MLGTFACSCADVCVFSRRMFPHCKVSLSGLIPCAKYILLVDMVPEDGYRYKVRTAMRKTFTLLSPTPPRPPVLSADSALQRLVSFPVFLIPRWEGPPSPRPSFYLCGTIPSRLTDSRLVSFHSGIKTNGRWREKRSPSLPAGRTSTRTLRPRGATG